MPVGTHDATPSWSGYIYQGKVALYHALRVINEKLSNQTDHQTKYSFDKYSLEIEWMEDFAIMKGGAYESIHQVKAYKDSKPNNYKSATVEIIQKLDFYSIPAGYLHVWKEIEFKGKIVDFEDMKKRYKPHCLKTVLNRLKLYTYGKNNFCGLREIDGLILKEIEKYYGNTPAALGSNIKKTIAQYKGVLLALYNILDEQIVKRHINYGSSEEKSSEKKDTISFKKIIDAFSVNYEEQSEEYAQIMLKNEIFAFFDDFCKDPKLCKFLKCTNCFLNKITDILNGLPPSEVRGIIEKASPQLHTKGGKLSSLYNNKIGILGSLFIFFYSIDFNKKVKEPKVFKYNLKEKKSKKIRVILPTTISGGPLLSNTIAIDILNNPNLNTLENLYDVDRMISHDVTISNLGKHAANIRDVNVDDWRDNQHIAKIRVKKVTKLKNFKGAFE